MISLKVLSAAAAMAVILPLAAPSVSFAQGIPPGMHRADTPGYSGPLTGGGGNVDRGGGAGTVGPNRNLGGGGGPQYNGGGGGGRGPQYGGGGRPQYNGGNGGGPYRGGGGGGGYYRHGGGGGGGFIPGAVAGAIVGGAIASGGGYYGGPGYYAPGYDSGYYDEGAVAVAPGGDDSVAYCMQTYRSYDPRSGTYMGNDGYRHPCP